MKQTIQEIANDTAHTSAAELVEFAVRAGLWSKTDLSRESGITMATLLKFERGGRITAAHRNAIRWALAVRLGVA